MNVAILLEHRFECTPEGAVWTRSAFPYSFWARYLEVFRNVHVVARVKRVGNVPSTARRADGQGVSFSPIPYYVGPKEYALRAIQVRRHVRAAVTGNHAVILRVASQIASCAEPVLRGSGRPYGVEVVGDPYDVFAPGSVNHPLRPVLRWWCSRRLRHQCAGAAAAAYVTEYALQSRYPAAPEAFSTSFSDAELPPAAYVEAPRTYPVQKRQLNLVTVGSLEQLYKAPDTLIDAVKQCVARGLDLNLVLVGDGRYRPELQRRARSLGRRIRFVGQLPSGEAVRSALDEADLFVLPSRTEGLPRAMVEAMARALPCIGSTVGGIPELLMSEDLVAPGNAGALALKISEVAESPQRMNAMSRRNLAKAREYGQSVIHERSVRYWRTLRGRTEEWLSTSRRAG